MVDSSTGIAGNPHSDNKFLPKYEQGWYDYFSVMCQFVERRAVGEFVLYDVPFLVGFKE